ncbi:MAG: matrixin family metalloprotease [Myxococcales bacterium]
MPKDGACPAPGTWLQWERQCISFTVAPRSTDDPPLDDIRDAVARSFRRWQAIRCGGRPIGFELGETEQLGACREPEYNVRGANANTVFFIDDWVGQGLDEDAFGLTLIWHDPNTGEIYDADMQLNEMQGRFDICGAVCPVGVVDLENVVTHEAGHFLGLGHSLDRSATMSARATLGETIKRSLEADDVQGMCEIYGDWPEPACELADFTPDNGFSPECGAPAVDGGGRNACVCSAPGARAAGRGSAGVWLLAGLLPWWFQRRARRRPVAKSSATPRPISR